MNDAVNSLKNSMTAKINMERKGVKALFANNLKCPKNGYE